ncbi:16S rRNA (guanine(527)-N(7))-methyltransferase RsmG [Pseudoramibacter sp.]|jgi:16S rRNA (guanine527-N7)-methyltransferase|uniref:16S rRNA (guanine(527)-N(7))-methyltransferase RsmG n=1 Tax=Pseudoramibacter sp. TaxID=2034862 RepID=UPI0025EB6EC7|nr:16S rRNA (guanine(527)-N(7))-methyltransferase RsmG [Pseudoramibacter sp.]MCH4071924.1 16S rRNA (guanine(527)-N(7))-methyltransferase RsmG [Pseudoramibacter sp.]MCH4105692.1 16S rRNA (guanine(527)-N(7))-methyltransferase RsmG [Pseudoramibacter sp.]
MNDQTYLKFAEILKSESPLPITEDQSRLFYDFMNAMKEMNQRVNLTRILDEKDFIEKHLLDAITCPLKSSENQILDLGSGGGIPGVPLAIYYPDKHFTLLDSTAKKMKAVKEITETIGLKNVTCVAGRAEELGKRPEYRETFDAVCARAVAAFNILDELCAPFLKTGGTFYAWKGQQAEEEIAAAKSGPKKLGLGEAHITQNLMLKSAAFHVIIQCDKIASTPSKYPRNYGRIVKKPLA